MSEVWAIGFMTGTSVDGVIDVSIIRTDGERVTDFGPHRSFRYEPKVVDLLRKAVSAAHAWDFEGPKPEIFARAEEELSRAQAQAGLELLKHNDIRPEDVHVAGFHGQTVIHRPPTPERIGATLQLGDGQLMADIMGIDTVFDFRTDDVRAGGNGAPLAPVYHSILLERAGRGAETAVQNLGGVGNITWVESPGHMIAFDTGPGNGPLDSWISAHGQGPMDRGGLIAQQGNVHEERLSDLLTNPYFTKPYPKSLDRYSFTMEMASDLSLEDGAALLTAFPAAAIGKGLDLLPKRPKQLVVCGGGRKNPQIMRQIAQRCGVLVESAEDLSWNGDFIEAECFALLAVRRVRNLPISFPTTTGAPHPMTGGRIARTKMQGMGRRGAMEERAVGVESDEIPVFAGPKEQGLSGTGDRRREQGWI